MSKVVTAVLLLCTVSMCKSSSNTIFYGLTGNSIFIPITRPPAIDEIICTLQGNKVFEWEVGQGESYFGKFVGRTNLTMDTMEIKNLQQSDSGTYKLSFIYLNGSTVLKSFSLIVNAPLSQPTINCTANSTNVHLQCNVEDGLSVTIQWMHEDSIIGQDDNFDLSLGNKSLTIFNPEKSAGEYACIVKQHGDQAQSGSINIENCYSRGNGHRGHGGLIAVVLVPVVGFIIGIFFYCQKQKKNRSKQGGYKTTSTEDPKNVSPEGSKQGGYKTTSTEDPKNVSPEGHEIEPSPSNE